MKRYTILTLVVLVSLLAACASNAPVAQNQTTSGAAVLAVSWGESAKSYTRVDLEALPAMQAVFNDITYQGVTLSALLEDAGLDPAQIKAVKAVANDGYSVNYDPDQVLKDDVIVAYALAEGDLTADDGAFRMVIPGAEGKLNVRMLVEIQIMQ